MKRSRSILAACTWLVVLWPLVQIALVFGAHTNPWRLMGFAMYATDHDIVVTLRKKSVDGNVVDVEPRDLPPAARDAYDDFVARRTVLGRLHSPESFVKEWRRADSTLGSVEIDIEVRRLSHARMTTVARDRVSL